MATQDKKATDAPKVAAPDRDAQRQDAQDKNFENARKTAAINHENDVNQNLVGGCEGVEVRDAKPVEVINPVRNASTGELEDDTRTLKQSPEEVVGSPKA